MLGYGIEADGRRIPDYRAVERKSLAEAGLSLGAPPTPGIAALHGRGQRKVLIHSATARPISSGESS
jgi:hypothetical protein